MEYRFRDVYLLTAAAEDEEDTPRRAIENVEGWVECFPKVRMAGTLFCGGVNDPGDFSGSSKLEDARKMGAEA